MSWRDEYLVAGLVALVLLAYASSFPGEFHFDDYALMLENPHVVGSSFSPALFLEQFGGRPLTLWTFHWNYHLFGPNPAAFHAVSVALHLVATGLLFTFLQRQVRRVWPAFLAALVFAVHPVQTQAVNYIWSRSVLLMFCLGLGSLLLVQRRPWWSLLLFQLAIWSRTDGVIFLVPLLWLNRRFWKVPVFLTVVNVGAFAAFAYVYQPREVGWAHSAVMDYWFGQGVALWRYVGLVLWPAGLSIDHGFRQPGTLLGLLAAGGVLALWFVIWRFRTLDPLAAAGAFWFFLVLAPGVITPNTDPVNESRLYPAVAGVALMIASGLPKRGAAVTLALVGLLAIAVPVTVSRNALWNDDEALGADAAGKYPDKSRVYYNLGAAQARKGEVEKGERAFTEALRLNPTDDWSHAALGYCAEVREDWSMAVHYYQRAVSLNSANAYAREGLDRVLGFMGAAGVQEQL
jgi:protein O-mannosyl-transferase